MPKRKYNRRDSGLLLPDDSIVTPGRPVVDERPWYARGLTGARGMSRRRCCCGPKVVGFDRNVIWPCIYAAYADTVDYVVSLPSDISDLSGCDLVYCGLKDCNETPAFSSEQYDTVRQWVENGGRILISGDFHWAGDPWNRCMTVAEIDTWNAFSAALGSSISLGATATTETGCSNDKITNTETNLLSGISQFQGSLSSTLTGGTWLLKSNISPNPVIMAIEAIEDGWVIGLADSDAVVGYGACGCLTDTMTFLNRWLTYSNANLP